jgi:hypothetical protein
VVALEQAHRLHFDEISRRLRSFDADGPAELVLHGLSAEPI